MAAQTKIAASAAQKPFYVGIDVGGTNIKIGIVDDDGQTLTYHTMPTEQDKGAEDASRRVGAAVREMIAKAGIAKEDLAYAGLATPGPMDIPNGMILRPGNLPGWWDSPVRDLMGRQVGTPVAFANDANAAAYGEFWRGAGEKYHSLVLLTLGTGVGGGIIIGDTLVEGEHSCGSECGHILINPADDAPMDSLGKRGSLESHCNASALVERAKRALANVSDSQLSKRLESREELTPRIIAEEAERGDEMAKAVIMETGYWLAIGIVSFIHTIDPDAIILGGAMTFGGDSSPIGREFIQTIRDEVRPRILEPLRDVVKIEFASLGGDAGYIGAAGLARLEHRKAR